MTDGQWRFPERHEWLWLFESEPEPLHGSDTWEYGMWRFSWQRDGVSVVCEVQPAGHDVSLSLHLGGEERLSLRLDALPVVRIERQGDAQLLSIQRSDPSSISLVLRLKPSVQLGGSL